MAALVLGGCRLAGDCGCAAPGCDEGACATGGESESCADGAARGRRGVVRRERGGRGGGQSSAGGAGETFQTNAAAEGYPPGLAGGPLIAHGQYAHHPDVAPLPMNIVGNWAPAGVDYPWPGDEWLRDGGDSGLPAKVDYDWSVQGLDVEDTVGHYDTLDGETIVEPSNQVYIYTPRFASVRSVSGAVSEEQIEILRGQHMPEGPVGMAEVQQAVPRFQAEQAITDITERQPGEIMTREWANIASQRLLGSGFDNVFSPYEDLLIMRRGVFEQDEKAQLSQVALAAITWSSDQAVQVLIDGQRAHEDSTVQKPQVTYTIDEPGAPKLRVVKVASTAVALPGDIVDFTIRFDNIGTRVMGNVTILDNLNPRLEYVPDSAQSSLDADFSTEQNESGSLVLRWEIVNPIEKSDGGLVRFKAKVR